MHTAREVVLYLCAAMVIWSGVRLIQERLGAENHPPVELLKLLRRPVPPFATFLAALMAVMAVVQIVHPSVIGTLERDPGGAWWHCVTALLVQSDGWEQIIFNYAALVAIAPFAERMVGSRPAALVYLVSGVAAQAVSTAGWYPIGAGNSVALCGQLAACATLYILRGPDPALRHRLLLIPTAALILCALTNNHGIGLLTGCVFGATFAALNRWPVAGDRPLPHGQG
jgi:membrane associated rhomboid family serine protease